MPDPVRRALRTALQVFVAVFGLQLIGWLDAVQQWAADGGTFPDVAVLGKAAIAGVAAAAVSLVTWAQNALEDRGAVPSVGKHGKA